MKKIGYLLFIAGLLYGLWSCSRPMVYPLSSHFDGKRFFNTDPPSQDQSPSHNHFWSWWQSMRAVAWPEWINDPPQPRPPQYVAAGGLRVTFINHATTLIQMEGMNFLTDPVWAQRASMLRWLGPRRVRAPGIAMQDLPPIDVILLSHNHYDHMDIPSLRWLSERHQAVVVTGLGMKTYLTNAGIARVVELDWWQSYRLAPQLAKIFFVPARHGSGRGLFDRDKSLWGGFVIQSAHGHIYFAGDTAYGEFVHELQKKFGAFRLALLPIGHYQPRMLMQDVHISPDEAVRMHRLLRVGQSIGIHFGTFHGFGNHNSESIEAPIEDLKTALASHDVPKHAFIILNFGEGFDVP